MAKVFGYGTLMRAGDNHYILQGLGARFVGEAMTAEPRKVLPVGHPADTCISEPPCRPSTTSKALFTPAIASWFAWERPSATASRTCVLDNPKPTEDVSRPVAVHRPGPR